MTNPQTLQEDAHCSRHRKSLKSQTRNVKFRSKKSKGASMIKDVEQKKEEVIQEPKCDEECAIHCPKPGDEKWQRDSMGPFIDNCMKISDRFQEDLTPIC